MSNINRVIISAANLTRDPDASRHRRAARTVLAFGVAVNDRRRNPQTGEWEDVHQLHRLHHVRAQRAEALSRIPHQGLEGVPSKASLRYSSW